MTFNEFNKIVSDQTAKCANLLMSKGFEYAPNARAESSQDLVCLNDTLYEDLGGADKVTPKGSKDRLAHFKKAAAITGTTPKEALLGMLAKHLVSVSDMCTDGGTYSLDRWDEKITDSINYLILLRAIVEEEQNGQN